MDTGIRLSECANILEEELRLPAMKADVRAKTGFRTVAFGPTTRGYIEDYLGERRRHRFAASPWLWISERRRHKQSHFEAKSLQRIAIDRGKPIGLDVSLTLFRRTLADPVPPGDPANGVPAGDSVGLTKLRGWSNVTMAGVYARATASRRARDTYLRNTLVDRPQAGVKT